MIEDLLYFVAMSRYRRLISNDYYQSKTKFRSRRKVKGVKYFGTYRPIKHFGVK